MMMQDDQESLSVQDEAQETTADESESSAVAAEDAGQKVDTTPWKPKTPRVASPAKMALHNSDPLAPAIILVDSQLGENIGTVARAMLNTGLDDLRLVRPRVWPSDYAEKAASGALHLLHSAKLYDTTAEAVADLSILYATTARDRNMIKPIQTPRKAAETIRAEAAGGARCGVLFGRERSGLENDDIALADRILQVPLNPAFTSLNLAQAVLLFGYEWWTAEVDVPEDQLPMGNTFPAAKEDLIGFFEHLERELDEAGFLMPVEKRPRMVRNLRNMFSRCELTDQDVRTLRGVVKALTRKKSRVPQG